MPLPFVRFKLVDPDKAVGWFPLGLNLKIKNQSFLDFYISQRARATTKKIESPADLEGFPDLNDPEKDEIRQLIKEFVMDKSPAKPSSAAKKKKTGAAAGGSGGTQTTLPGASPVKPSTSGK